MEAEAGVPSARGSGRGWMIATIVLIVLLLAAGGVIVYLLVDRSDLSDSNRTLEEQVEANKLAIETMQGQLDEAVAELASAQSALAQAQAQSAAAPANSDMDMLKAVVKGDLYLSDPDRDWSTTGWKIDGDWATLSAGDPSDQSFQGFQMFYKKTDGQWVFVTLGTGLMPGDVPGAPAELFQ